MKPTIKFTKPDVTLDEAFKEPQKWIPEGIYCYRIEGRGENIFSAKVYLCPFWHRLKDKETMEDGYCYYLGTGDFEKDGISLLWDMCKECGVNDFDEQYEEQQ